MLSRQLSVLAAIVAAFGLMSGVATFPIFPRAEASGRLQPGATPDHVTIRLRPVGASGVSGKATLRAADDITSVAIRIAASHGAYPAHIHRGTCAQFEAMPRFPLADAKHGRTTRTLVEMPLADLLAGSYVINLHRPSTHLETLLDPSSVVACGAIAVEQLPTSSGGTGGVVMPPVTGVGTAITHESTGRLSFGLAAVACALVGAGFLLRRSARLPSSRNAI
jgi:hypothetical protein